MRCLLIVAIVLVMMPATLRAEIDVGSDGSDGALQLFADETIDLSLAVTGSWDDPGSGAGIYDPEQWAVVYKFSSVEIASGVEVGFINHPSGAPVVWLVAGNVTIDGTVILDGQDGTGSAYTPSEGGPGAFRGGRAYASENSLGGAGLGPGGGLYPNGAGSFATPGGGSGPAGPTYGNARLLPLIGGSGGAATESSTGFGGGAGGGAILVAANNTIQITGAMTARGGDGNSYILSNGGCGSGGGIRLIADTIISTGALNAEGGTNDRPGGAGYIRLEANTLTADPTSPNFSALTPLGEEDPVIWPPSDAPSLVVVSINGEPVPVDPGGEFTTPPGDVNLSAPGPVDIVLEATNLPTTSSVLVRLIPKSGQDQNVVASLASGDESFSTWTAVLDTLPQSGFAAVQARAELP